MVKHSCVDTNSSKNDGEKSGERIWGRKKVLLSINRFERKKDVEPAFRAYAGLTTKEGNLYPRGLS